MSDEDRCQLSTALLCEMLESPKQFSTYLEGTLGMNEESSVDCPFGRGALWD